jgi:hypothetical protein
LIKKWADDDSLVVQYRHYTNEPWIDIKEPSWKEGFIYRIKPEVIRYRVALLIAGTITADDIEEEKDIESLSFFKEWITDWIEVEVNE